MQSRRAALANLSALVASLTASPLLQAAGASARMPSIFIGHGSPMNAISRNSFTDTLAAWGKRLPRPRAIVVVSAHWLSRGATGVTSNPAPPTIHDFSGFPRELQEMTYPAKGDPRLAREIASLIRSQRGVPTTEWGLDHGTWTVLHHLFPGAPVPVLQVSIDYDQGAAFHLAIGRELAALREKGVLVVGSGNIVHNLRATDRGTPEGQIASRPWAAAFDEAVKAALSQRDDKALLAYENLDGAAMAVATPDHYWPFLYALGAADAGTPPATVFEGFHSGTLSMRCLQFG
ncbi:4,5-DOPA dioxygenase extradiol [Methylibium petroleiphilum]|uniref:Extradiol ring-cleavage dioxygenase class III enzyme subunit B domain-containing protein n=1 Tax=Methylibium petroleiphilum (strain ATCC BAA-1232 / LMG 22953 / PM1) TaxID=420662 RepID=A2SMW2_METPP|nr:4,5-DOPA dioxygenase extradiol [Methylibium petroleiphilum]ABM96901.1 conserved hypothetical protein [Methylibium petroleiphilum PM1]